MNMTTITFTNTLKDNLQVKIHIRNLLPLPKEKNLKKNCSSLCCIHKSVYNINCKNCETNDISNFEKNNKIGFQNNYSANINHYLLDII